MKTLTTRTDLSALNKQQRKAVLSQEKRVLVLAGAGSGKTNTLLQKIHYLINDEQAEANSILAITFTKNAANEMIDRMILSTDKTGFYKQVLETNGISQKDIALERNKMLQKYSWLNQITIKTIHSLCYQIMRNEGVHVFDNKFKIVPKFIDNSNEFIGNSATETESEIAQKVLIKLSENKEYLIALKRYIIDYFVDKIKENDIDSEFRPEGKLFTTLKGDKVRSKSEQFIADWLFRNSIEYKYEYQVRINNKKFHPDFFIPAANIYLEHISNLSYPSFWKDTQLKKGGLSCIKTYDKITHNSAVFNQVLDIVIKGRISKDLSSVTVLNYNEEFALFKTEIQKFLRSVLDIKGAIKSSQKSINDIAAEAAKNKHQRVRLFYKIAIPIIKGYQDYCENKSYLDFDDLISYSLKLFKEHANTKKRYQDRFQYVLVDEFQDVDNQQVQFLKNLVSNKSQLFCVGDDWQSIYGFRGSEIEYIVNFKEHFLNPKIIKLNLNYRSTDAIVKASNEIIKKNRFQVSKEISAVQKGGAKIEVHYEELKGESENFIWEKVKQLVEQGIPQEEILILYRRSAMIGTIQKSLKASGVNVQFKTIHGSKGLEAQVVFILGLNSAPGGFPDPWMQDKIYHVIKKTEYNTLLEEERRLFYVALTRAKKHLFLMSQKGNVSEFIKDIPKDLMLINEEEEKGLEFEYITCSKCSSKIEEYYKFCPECGKSILSSNAASKIEAISFDYIKEKINLIPLKHKGWLDDHIYKSRLKNRRAFEPWVKDEIKILSSCCKEFNIKELSELFGRSERGITSRLNELGLK